MFPSACPEVITFIPANVKANIADVPVFRAPVAGDAVAARFFVNTAVTGNSTNYVDIKLHKLGNTTHAYAALNVIANVNINANTWQALTASSTYTTWSAGDTIALTVTFKSQGGVNFGITDDRVIYQIDVLPASYPRGTI